MFHKQASTCLSLSSDPGGGLLHGLGGLAGGLGLGLGGGSGSGGLLRSLLGLLNLLGGTAKRKQMTSINDIFFKQVLKAFHQVSKF